MKDFDFCCYCQPLSYIKAMQPYQFLNNQDVNLLLKSSCPVLYIEQVLWSRLLITLYVCLLYCVDTMILNYVIQIRNYTEILNCKTKFHEENNLSFIYKLLENANICHFVFLSSIFGPKIFVSLNRLGFAEFATVWFKSMSTCFYFS